MVRLGLALLFNRRFFLWFRTRTPGESSFKLLRVDSRWGALSSLLPAPVSEGYSLDPQAPAPYTTAQQWYPHSAEVEVEAQIGDKTSLR